ncbi:hypothetical protein QT327_21365 [Olivibacter sp. 47]|uniref:hypothetical protein n=1 Tax=Olivibacter sp. 47 TaxID=3056486 RepID=UPI0025A37D66|nr:hypothetical protein [Olivibacter sp. 47]MDM8176866.1 hypothetical protein [Olivibacter sp. 47]
MQRNEMTTMEKLSLGDRFYFANDKKRLVWQKVEHETTQTKYRTYKHFALLASVVDNPCMKEEYKKNLTKAVNKDTAIVFLRRAAV